MLIDVPLVNHLLFVINPFKNNQSDFINIQDFSQLKMIEFEWKYLFTGLKAPFNTKLPYFSNIDKYAMP